MEKKKKLRDRGITLIALIVSIIVLLILAGVSIAVLTGENGIINRTTESKTTSEIAKVEEVANLELTDSIIGVRAGQKGATERTVAQIAKYLKDEGYIEDYDQTGLKTITGMSFGSVETDGIVLGVDTTSEEITASFSSMNPSEDYYVQISGKKYPIAKTNGRIKITPTELTLGIQPKGEITSVEVNSTGTSVGTTVASATIAGDDNTAIQITGIAKGTANVIAKYTNDIYATIPVTVKGRVTVTFNVNEGIFASGETGIRTGVEGTTMTLPTAPTVTDGNVFKGWYTASDGGTLLYEKTVTSSTYPESNATIYAQYGPDVATVDEVGDGTSIVWYNGSKNWEVFFKDNGRTYLIYKNYSDPTKTVGDPASLVETNLFNQYSDFNSFYPTTTGGTSSETHEHLTDYLSDVVRFPATANWLTKYTEWMAEDDLHVSDAYGLASTLYLLDQNIWKYGTLTPNNESSPSVYYDPDYADWVIGGPTLEMFIATLNTGKNRTYTYEVNGEGYYRTPNGVTGGTLPAYSLWYHGNNTHHETDYWLAAPYQGQEAYSNWAGGIWVCNCWYKNVCGPYDGHRWFPTCGLFTIWSQFNNRRSK